MGFNIKISVFLFFYFSCFIISGQTGFDSLKQKLSEAEDEDKIEIYETLAKEYMNEDLDQSEKYAKDGLLLAHSEKEKKKEGDLHHLLGRIYRSMQKEDKALVQFNASIEIREEIKDYKGLNQTYGNIGEIYLYRGDLDKAIDAADKMIENGELSGYERGLAIGNNLRGNIFSRKGVYDKANIYYQEALKLFEKQKNDLGVGMCLNNIALIYQNLGKHEESLDYFVKAYRLRKRINDIYGTGEAANNIGNFYSFLVEKEYATGNYDKANADSALFYYMQAKDLFEQAGYITGQGSASQNIALMYIYAGNYKFALESFFAALSLLEEHKIQNQYEYANIYKGISLCYVYMKEYDKAKDYAKRSVDISKEAGLKEMEMMGHKYLASIFDSLKVYEKALRYYENYVALQDCLRTESNEKIIAELKTKYQTEKKEQEIINQKMLNEKKQNQLYIALGSAFIVLIVLIQMIRQYLQKRKANNKLQHQNEEISQQKEEIETQRDEIFTQKELIEDQQRGIMDSIQYASRIQEAILPQSDAMRDIMGDDHFVLFKPRDIVSGDFFWMGKIGKSSVIVAADCTGHGVPGAFMSMLGTAFLNEIINAKGVAHANDILNDLRNLVIASLNQTGKAGEQKDGMDLSLYIIDEKKTKIDFAGANNPVLIIRPLKGRVPDYGDKRITVQVFTCAENGKDYQVITIKGDKMPIGIYADNKPFDRITFKIHPGDALYSFSDGYQDQFGGPKNKKFMVKKLKQLMVDSYLKDMEVQHIIFDETIEDWKKQGQCEQIDDILIIGMKV